ncbi:MAG TPA: hypothetical protein VMG14_08730 [Thermoplasmata archaeon]|nr:hypothetical protein [Thermoplasmata archaeon]
MGERTHSSTGEKDRKVVDWLLEPSQPAVRYRTLTELLGRAETDPDVRAAKAAIPSTGWATRILARRDPAGWWVHGESLYTPKYLATTWNLLALSDLGMTRADPDIRASCELWMDRSPLDGGGVGGLGGKGKGHHCYTGNMARALIKFGYGEDRRVEKALDWLARTAHPNGGSTCWSSGNGPARSRTLDSWEGLSAFAVYPRAKWSRSMKECVERGAEYYLGKELHRQGTRHEPWFRFHWPVHYFYDLLVGLDVVTALGYAEDPRLGFALDLLRTKRRADGRWNLDAVHPDGGPEYEKYFREHPNDRPTPLTFEPVGRPSKMITLRALTVLSRVGRGPASQVDHAGM